MSCQYIAFGRVYRAMISAYYTIHYSSRRHVAARAVGQTATGIPVSVRRALGSQPAHACVNYLLMMTTYPGLGNRVKSLLAPAATFATHDTSDISLR